MGGIYPALAGVLCLVGVRWFAPREMRRIRQQIIDRGGSPARLDAQMESRLWRFLLRASLPIGVFAIVVGIVLVVIE
jgi:hypothetical protein